MKIDNIYEFLQDTTDDNEKYMLYLEGDDTLPSLAEIIKEEYKNQCSFSADEAWECITNCMEYYLDSFELSIVYKKKIWNVIAFLIVSELIFVIADLIKYYYGWR